MARTKGNYTLLDSWYNACSIKSGKFKSEVIMKNKFKVQSLKFKVNKRIFLFFLIFLLFTVQYSLFNAYADEIYSRAVVVMDASTGKILYAKNPSLRLPPASTTKLMTALVAIENADLSDVVAISRKASRVAPHKAGFKK